MALFQDVANTIKKAILNGELKPGDSLPSVREMSETWGCAPGTIQRAYHELTLQGLVSTQIGQGSYVADQIESHTPLRRAALVNQIETFTLTLLASGYAPLEISDATHEVLERWQARVEEPLQTQQGVIRFAGSHDPVISLLAQQFQELVPGYSMKVSFVGSLGGLIALARYGADMAGCHLWDEESRTYNEPYIKRMLPGRRVALLTLAHRRLGLIVTRGNPHSISSLEDLARPGITFINRQWGAGTRVWLDNQLKELGMDSEEIEGYDREVNTHLEIAGAVADGKADVGVGVESAALAYGLDFLLLTTERYDLVVPSGIWDLAEMQLLVGWLRTAAAKEAILALGGYDTSETGEVRWVE